MYPSKSTPRLLIGFFLVLALGIGLRIYAFQANTRAYGDVNTIRISARQYAKIGIIQYPWHIDRFESTLNDPLATPAYMHGPTLPFMAGLLSKLTNIQDTFTTLKLLTFAAGFAILLLAYRLGTLLHSPQMGILTMLLVATSPVLIDFSANGSPYIIATAFLLGVDIALARFDFKCTRDYAVLGLLCSFAFLFLQAMLALTVAIVLLGILNIRRITLKGVMTFVIVWLICYLPAMIWYMHYFGRPFISQQLNYIATELSLSTQQREDFISHPLSLFSSSLFERYLSVMWGRFQVYVENLTFEISLPMVWVGIGVIVASIFYRPTRTKFGGIIVTRVAYLGVTSVGLALLHTRFLVPVVSGLLPIVVIGMAYFSAQRRVFYRIFSGLLIAYAGWAIWSYSTLDTPPTRYYHNEAAGNSQYDYAESIGEMLAEYSPEPVIGCGDARRAIYSTDSRLVVTGCEPTGERILTLLANPDTNGRYLLYTREVIQTLLPSFPEARIIAQNEVFAVLDLTPDPE